MNRILRIVVLVLAASYPLGAPSGAEDDRVELQAELDAILGEILESIENGDRPAPSLEDLVPDLVVLSSSDVRGEVDPCG